MTHPWWRQEDWLATGLGALFLIAIVLGVPLAAPGFKWSDGASLGRVLGALPQVAGLCAVCLLASLPGALALGSRALHYALGFPVVFLLAWLAQIAAGNSTVNYWGIEYVIFALAFGLAISNGPGTPAWLKDAVRSEYFIKTGLVIMGATILIDDIVAAGALGMLQACLVVAVVWYAAYAIARRMRLDEEFAVILASAVSICGVSAAIAACGAIQGDRRKLSYVASVVLVVAVPMIVLMPWFIGAAGIPDAVGGAWLGGTLDTTGSVVAASALISETATKVGTIVKFSQNLLIGVAAFLLAVWWSVRRPATDQVRPRIGIIWERFPKFVLGFVAASILFSLVLSPAAVKETRAMVSAVRTWWFALAFASIGLETRFSELLALGGKRPLAAFLLAQGANIVWTLLLAWLIFGGVLFEVPRI